MFKARKSRKEAEEAARSAATADYIIKHVEAWRVAVTVRWMNGDLEIFNTYLAEWGSTYSTRQPKI